MVVTDRSHQNLMLRVVSMTKPYSVILTVNHMTDLITAGGGEQWQLKRDNVLLHVYINGKTQSDHRNVHMSGGGSQAAHN